MGEMAASSKEAAQRLRRWSNVIAWPGVVILFLGVPQASKAAGGTVATLVAVVSIAMIVVGTVLGQKAKTRLKSLGHK